MTRHATGSTRTLAGRSRGAALALLAPVALALPASGQDTLVDDLRFKGGTLAEFVAELDKQNGDDPVNVLYRGGAESVRVDDMRLAWVEVEAALGAVADMSGLRLTVKPGGAGVPVFILTRLSSPFAGDEPRIDTHILPLGEELGLTGEALVSEVDVIIAAAELALDGRTRPEFKLHPPTGLLIVRGTPSQINTVEQVVEQVSSGYRSRSAERYELERQRLAAEAKIRQLQTELRTAMEAHELASEEYREIQALQKAGGVSQGEANRVRMYLIESDGQVKGLEVQLELAKDELELIERQTGEGEKREYRRSGFHGAESAGIEAIRAVGRASHSAIRVEVSESVVSVWATAAQHNAVKAILSAMDAARSN